MTTQISASIGSIGLIGTLLFGGVLILKGLCGTAPDDDLVARPTGLPIIDHLLDFMPHTIIDFMQRLWDTHQKGVVELYVFGDRHFLVFDPETCKDVLVRRPKMFRRPKSFDWFAQEMNITSGLFHVNGVQWNRIHRLIAPSLSPKNIGILSTSIFCEALRLQDKLTEVADGKQAVEVKSLMAMYTTRVVTRVTIGQDPLDSLPHLQKYLCDGDFFRDSDQMLAFGLETAMFPFPRWVWNLSPYHKKIDRLAHKANTRLGSHLQTVIDYKRKLLQQGTNLHTVIDTLLLHEETRATDDELVANVKTFYLAGSETTATALSWTLFFLCTHPQWFAAVRKEADEWFAVQQVTRPPSDDDDDDDSGGGGDGNDYGAFLSLGGMPNIRAVLRESLRLRSPSPFLVHQLEDGIESFTTSTGLTILSSDKLLLVGPERDGNLFKDPKSFNPDRWISSPPELLVKMKESLIFFGAGPRTCPGFNLALVEAAMALVVTCHSFDLALACPAEDIVRVHNFTVVPNKVPIIFTPRQ